jgi:hypothetical protein
MPAVAAGCFQSAPQQPSAWIDTSILLLYEHLSVEGLSCARFVAAVRKAQGDVDSLRVEPVSALADGQQQVPRAVRHGFVSEALLAATHFNFKRVWNSLADPSGHGCHRCTPQGALGLCPVCAEVPAQTGAQQPAASEDSLVASAHATSRRRAFAADGCNKLSHYKQAGVQLTTGSLRSSSDQQ